MRSSWAPALLGHPCVNRVSRAPAAHFKERQTSSGSRSLALAQLPVQVPSGLRAVALGPHSSRLWGTSRATTGLQRAWLGVAHAALQVLLSGQSAPRWVESRPSPSFAPCSSPAPIAFALARSGLERFRPPLRAVHARTPWKQNLSARVPTPTGKLLSRRVRAPQENKPRVGLPALATFIRASGRTGESRAGQGRPREEAEEEQQHQHQWRQREQHRGLPVPQTVPALFLLQVAR